ncbi:hypothetical protein PRVXH_001559 [Proteinivorax hydrogeniformans]|uniref:Uncharacterized protein n=1 Tax=Proteinivorax hydrogeniformans TaxID=1826727 RepID=A0AAU8HR98_9FIRM
MLNSKVTTISYREGLGLLEVYDCYDNLLGLVVGEYEGSLLVAIGDHKLKYYGEEYIDFELMEMRCAKKLFCVQRERHVDKKKLFNALQVWWEKRYSEPFHYYKGVILYNLKRKDWAGFNLLEAINTSHFVLLPYKNLNHTIKTSFDKGKLFLEEVGFRGISCEVYNYPKVVYGERRGAWKKNEKNDSQVKTELSLKSGDVCFIKKYPYLIPAKKGDKVLVKLNQDMPMEIFCGGVNYHLHV